MMHGKAVRKPGIAEIVKVSRGFTLLAHLGLWPKAIKLNPS